jgi:hypothetical protein
MTRRALFGVFATIFLLAAAPGAAGPAAAQEQGAKPRLLVLTDIGGDPDDQQSLIRLLLYTCEFDVEGLIATASGIPGELKEGIVQPQLIRQIVEAYGRVQPNLLLHRNDYPPAKDLLGVIKSGNPKRGQASIGDGHDTEGSRWIITCAHRNDPRPLNITIWGGQTDLAQALWRVREERGAEGLKKLMSRLRVFDIGDQDKIQPWLFENFPDLFYILAKAPPGQDMRRGAYRGMYLGGDESLTSKAWIDSHVRKDHGPLGALYPNATWTDPNPHVALKEGDTPSWFYFLPTGLSDPSHPDWGCWGGRYQRSQGGLFRDAADAIGDAKPGAPSTSSGQARATVWRWRPDFQNDFAARMDWCVKPFAEANHPPTPVLNGDRSTSVLTLDALPDKPLALSAAGSDDPDKDSTLAYRWYLYPEAGAVKAADVTLSNADGPSTAVTFRVHATGQTAHIVLALTDDGQPALTRYRRAVIRVGKPQ